MNTNGTATTENLSIEQIANKLKNAAEFISSRVVNRGEVIEQAFCALLTGEHLLLQSRTGTGKTLLSEQLFGMFSGAHIFRVQASKEQQPDTYFGGLDIELLKTGKIVHNTDGSLVESEFGFIDEIFDANDFTLRALLSLLNERRLIRGVQNVPAKIHTVIAATNYLRVTEVTEALLDRFLYKAIILPDKDPFMQYKISQQYLQHSGRTLIAPQKIAFKELQYFHSFVTGNNANIEISVTPELLYFTNLVVRNYEFQRNRHLREVNKGASSAHYNDYYISPRTQAKSLDLLRALALLKGRTQILHDDVEKLYFVFATVGIPEEVAMYKKAYTTVLNTMMSSNGFEQIKVLLGFESLLSEIRKDHSAMERPLASLTNSQLKKTFLDWVKETIGGIDQTPEHNKKLIEDFLKDFIPACDETRELKTSLEKEMIRLFQEIEREKARASRAKLV